MRPKKALLLIMVLLLPILAYAQEENNDELAADALLTAKEDMHEMVNIGFGVSLINDTIVAAEKELYGENYTLLLTEAEHINQTEKKAQIKKIIQTLQESMQQRQVDYNRIMESAELVTELKDRAYEVYYQLTSLKLRLESLKQLNMTEEYAIYTEAESLFKDEQYDAAEEKIKEGFAAASRKEAEISGLKLLYQAGRDNITNYIQDNWKKLLLTTAILAVIGLLASWWGSILMTQKKLRKLELEKEVLIMLVKEAQQSRFVEGQITAEEYKIRMEGYEERAIDIDKIVPVLKERLEKRERIFAGIAKLPSKIKARAPGREKPARAAQKFYMPVKTKKRPAIWRAIELTKKALSKIRLPKLRMPRVKLPKLPTRHIRKPKRVYKARISIWKTTTDKMLSLSRSFTLRLKRTHKRLSSRIEHTQEKRQAQKLEKLMLRTDGMLKAMAAKQQPKKQPAWKNLFGKIKEKTTGYKYSIMPKLKQITHIRLRTEKKRQAEDIQKIMLKTGSMLKSLASAHKKRKR